MRPFPDRIGSRQDRINVHGGSAQHPLEADQHPAKGTAMFAARPPWLGYGVPRSPELPVRHAFLVLSLPCFLACGGRQRADEAPLPRDTLVHAMEAGGMTQDPAARAVGSWTLRATNRDNPGMRLGLTLDSATGRTFRTRVAYLMQGDLGIDPSAFLPTPGSVTADGAIRIEIGNNRGAPPGLIVGRLAGDTIHVAEFTWGGESQMARGTTWVLERTRTGRDGQDGQGER